jgi:hypothetical protein
MGPKGIRLPGARLSRAALYLELSHPMSGLEEPRSKQIDTRERLGM